MFKVIFNGYFPFFFLTISTILLFVLYLFLNKKRGGFCPIIYVILFVSSVVNLIYLWLSKDRYDISLSYDIAAVLTLMSGADLNFSLLLKGGLIKGNVSLRRMAVVFSGVVLMLILSFLFWSGADISFIKFLAYLYVIIKTLIVIRCAVNKMNIISISYLLQDKDALMFFVSTAVMLSVYALMFIWDGCMATFITLQAHFVLLNIFLMKIIFKEGKYNLNYPINITPLKDYSCHIIEDEQEYTEYGLNGIRIRLLYLFENEKPYLSPTLSINDVAQMLYTNTSYLSRLLNNIMEVNFNEFINNYRIKEAMRLFYENKSLTLRELCNKSGFRNTSSFNNAFRLNTGCTPGEWCRKVKRGDD